MDIIFLQVCYLIQLRFYYSNINWQKVWFFFESSIDTSHKIIDKNLGFIVIKRDYYYIKYQKHWSNNKTYSKILDYNPIYSLQKILYTVCYKLQLLEIYFKYIKARSKPKLSYFYVIPRVYKDF